MVEPSQSEQSPSSEMRILRAALASLNGIINGDVSTIPSKSKLADLSGISRSTLYRYPEIVDTWMSCAKAVSKSTEGSGISELRAQLAVERDRRIEAELICKGLAASYIELVRRSDTMGVEFTKLHGLRGSSSEEW